ncbi:MAG TPA: cysteine--tRNA ligase [Pirellulaceae bacterium]|nr:cysteine--tRNA ligase [Pirellulaceae bacterium]HMO90870.1 cysteine--tRNA ligase [Pirellulaceae bacterium]HMP68654.1 cysteine--tRNA ligase [Pirellulaceae bacterium]
MDIRFYNTLTRALDLFEPVDGRTVRMYSCGPTVYDFAHIGNFRSFLSADLLRRFLEACGFEVQHVMNVTDVGHMTDDSTADGTGEDKMQVAARRMKEDKKSGRVPEGAVDNPDDPYQIADYYREAFLQDGKRLGLKVASEYPQRVPCATRHIPQMIDMVQTLIDRGHAYVSDDGVVYYDVLSFPEYGRLSGNTLDKLQEGASGRLDAQDQAMKRHPADFMLWKPDPHHVMRWDSPWGAGYPGWHIECSAMARHCLQADVIDIHTGGEDLIFPHQECEIAQSCGTTGLDFFARFWIHTRFLLVEGQKMSKRQGNFFTVRDILEGKLTGSPVHPAVLRYELIRSHFGAQCNFTKKGLLDSATAVRRIIEFGQKIKSSAGAAASKIDNSHPIINDFLQALADNLNISAALAVVLNWISQPVDNPSEAAAVLKVIDSVLGILELHELTEQDVDTDVVELCKAIDEARKNRNYELADQHRRTLVEKGYEVRTTAEGTVAKAKLAFVADTEMAKSN